MNTTLEKPNTAKDQRNYRKRSKTRCNELGCQSASTPGQSPSSPGTRLSAPRTGEILESRIPDQIEPPTLLEEDRVVLIRDPFLQEAGKLTTSPANHTEVSKIKDPALMFSLLERRILHQFMDFSYIAHYFEQIQHQQLYLPQFASFEEYCRVRWGLEPEHIEELIQTKSVVDDLEPLQLSERVFPTSHDKIKEYYNLTGPERVKLAQFLEQQLTATLLRVEEVQEAKRMLFPNRCAFSQSSILTLTNPNIQKQ